MCDLRCIPPTNIIFRCVTAILGGLGRAGTKGRAAWQRGGRSRVRREGGRCRAASPPPGDRTPAELRRGTWAHEGRLPVAQPGRHQQGYTITGSAGGHRAAWWQHRHLQAARHEARAAGGAAPAGPPAGRSRQRLRVSVGQLRARLHGPAGKQRHRRHRAPAPADHHGIHVAAIAAAAAGQGRAGTHRSCWASLACGSGGWVVAGLQVAWCCSVSFAAQNPAPPTCG